MRHSRNSKYKYRNVSKLMKEFSVPFKVEGEVGHTKERLRQVGGERYLQPRIPIKDLHQRGPSETQQIQIQER